MSRRYPAHPMVGVGVVLLDGDQVLLIRRGNPPAQGEWSLPGGAQELGETLEATARRELLEETGLTAGTLTVVTAVDAIHRDADGAVEYHYTIVELTGHPATGTPRAAGDANDARWVGLDELSDHGVSPSVLAVITMARARIA